MGYRHIREVGTDSAWVTAKEDPEDTDEMAWGSHNPEQTRLHALVTPTVCRAPPEGKDSFQAKTI